ncbi:toxic anion resistance protein [Xylanimonas protaetiae]|uniref:Toxic anion resistance protein n=1 Tax=Xylanimonas protaetiae TaxID=2509457 RepID=A0A4P6FJG6_9MICO|nr:toxic anion resistance protein [Xylanimonas protaetiae]QAY70738.1 toxic anion resistance protein [Xylanimonas protaetiae]
MSTPTTTPAPTLILEAPAAAPRVTDAQAVATIAAQNPELAAQQSESERKAAVLVTEIAALDPQSPAFAQKVTAISSLGDGDIRSSALASNRMLERPAAQASDSSPQGKVGTTLVELRHTVTDLDPNRADLSGVKKVLKFLPGGNKIDRYFSKYQSAQAHLDAIIRSLASGQDELRKDNAAIEVERSRMWETMKKLGEVKVDLEALDAAVSDKIAQLEYAGDTQTAEALRSDVLFAVRQRTQDVMTQMAVSVQGYLAMDLVRKNNLELIRGVDRAQNTTIAALRTAVIVSQALGQQKLVLDQVNALNSTTSNLIEATSMQLRQQGAAIQQQAAQSTLEISKLQAAFDNVFATMDAIDEFRSQATESMAATISTLEQQVARAKPYVERAQRSIAG